MSEPKGGLPRGILDSLLVAAILAIVGAIWNMNTVTAGLTAQFQDIKEDVHDMKVSMARLQALRPQ